MLDVFPVSEMNPETQPAPPADALQQELEVLKRTLWTLYACNRALLRATDEQALLQEVCRCLVEVGGMRLAWVGYRVDDDAKSIQPVARVGFDDDYVTAVQATWADEERGRGPVGTAVRTGQPSWISNTEETSMAVWRAEALKRGYGSVLALPLKPGNDLAFGVLALYAPEPRAFDETTATQYLELANNLAYGVLALRTREEQRRTAEQLRRSEANLAEAQRLTHTGSWIRSVTGDEVGLWSQELLRIYGFDPATPSVTLETVLQRVHPEDREMLADAIHTAVRERTEFTTDHRVLLPDGTVKYIHGVGHPAFDEAGELRHFTGTAMDVTERHRADEALREAHAELARVARATTVGALTASIAHEVNQPLAAVVTNANAALRWMSADPPNLDEVRINVQRIVRDGHRASEIITRIRSLLRKEEAVCAPLALGEVMEEMTAFALPEARRRNVALTVSLGPGLPLVLADRVEVQQVLLNLVMNGIEAMDGISDRPRRLDITAQRHEPPALLVSVSDTGPGIEAANLERLFEPFFTTKSGGMGMGLAITRSIIETHGGRLWAAAHEGPGVTFHFTLPLAGGGAE